VFDFAFYDIDSKGRDELERRKTDRETLFKKLESLGLKQHSVALRNALRQTFPRPEIREDIRHFFGVRNGENKRIAQILMLTIPEVHKVASEIFDEAKPRYTPNEICDMLPGILTNMEYSVTKKMNLLEEKHKGHLILQRLGSNSILRLKKSQEEGVRGNVWSIELESYPEDEKVYIIIVALTRSAISVHDLLIHATTAPIRDIIHRCAPPIFVIDTKRDDIPEIYLVRQKGVLLYRYFLCDGDLAVIAENKSVPLHAAVKMITGQGS